MILKPLSVIKDNIEILFDGVYYTSIAAKTMYLLTSCVIPLVDIVTKSDFSALKFAMLITSFSNTGNALVVVVERDGNIRKQGVAMATLNLIAFVFSLCSFSQNSVVFYISLGSFVMQFLYAAILERPQIQP